MSTAAVAQIDYRKVTGKLNPALHGSNSAPPYHHRWFFDIDEELKSLHFQYSRTHDWALNNAGQRIIDTHFIFPLMHLDAKDPRNYYFRASDSIIKNTIDLGMKIFYRLGTASNRTRMWQLSTTILSCQRISINMQRSWLALCAIILAAGQMASTTT